MHFVDIYHLFTSTDKMHRMFQFHIFFINMLISLSLNDSAHNILNDVPKIIYIIYIFYMVLLKACSLMVLVSLMVSWCLSSSRV